MGAATLFVVLPLGAIAFRVAALVAPGEAAGARRIPTPAGGALRPARS